MHKSLLLCINAVSELRALVLRSPWWAHRGPPLEARLRGRLRQHALLTWCNPQRQVRLPADHTPRTTCREWGEREGGGGEQKRERVCEVGSHATRSHGLRRVGRRAHVARSAAHTPKSALHHTLTHLVRGTATASASCHGSPLLQPRRAPRPSRRADPPRRGRTSGESCSPPPSSTASARRAAA